MASIEVAKQECNKAKRLFTRTKNGSSNATDKQDDLEIIQNRFMDLKVMFSKVQQKHEVYVSLLNSIGEEFNEKEEEDIPSGQEEISWMKKIHKIYSKYISTLVYLCRIIKRTPSWLFLLIKQVLVKVLDWII